MGMWNKIDDFMKDVVKGAKEGVGKAERIKQTGTIKVNKGVKYNVSNILDNHVNKAERIYKKGMNDFNSLDDVSKKMFKNVKQTVDDAGGVFNDDVRNTLKKNHGEVLAKKYSELSKLSGSERVNAAKKMGLDLGTKKPINFNSIDSIDFSDAYHASEQTAGRTLGDFTGGGIYGSYKTYKNMEEGKKSLVSAIKEGHSVVNAEGEKALSGKKIAGTAATTVAGANLANRVFRDETGEIDIPIVPFI